MTGFILRRLCWGVLVLLAVGLLTFALTYLAPIDPARAIAGRHASDELVEQIRREHGLDQPLATQFVGYLGRVLRGDLGTSIQHGAPVADLILERFPATLQLAAAGIALELLIGVPLGVAAALRRGTWLDRAVTVAMSFAVALAPFWLGYLLLDLLAFRPRVELGVDLFPLGGYRPLDPAYLFLPALTIGITGAAFYGRLVRRVMIDELAAEYIRTAHAKGLFPAVVTWRHAFRNALPPVISQLGLDFGLFLGGVVIVEQVFSWPGIGRLAVEAMLANDVPLVMGVVLFATVWVVLANLAADLGHARLDPRVRF